jgi:acyl-CoA thioesterase-1
MSSFKRLHERLKEKADDVSARPVIYVAFGDSVVQGCMEYKTIEHVQVYSQLFKIAVEQRIPQTIFSIINSGVSGDTAVLSRSRWQRDLYMFQPDLITLSLGLNDCHLGESGLHDFLIAYHELIDGISQHTEADLLVLTPTMMMKEENSRIHERDRSFVPQFLKTAEAGHLEMYVNALRQLAVEEQVTCLDLYLLWEQMEKSGIDIHTRLANGINHPDRDFHQVIANSMEKKIFS